MEHLLEYDEYHAKVALNEQFFRCDDCGYDSGDELKDETWSDFLNRKGIEDDICPKCGSTNTGVY